MAQRWDRPERQIASQRWVRIRVRPGVISEGFHGYQSPPAGPREDLLPPSVWISLMKMKMILIKKSNVRQQQRRLLYKNTMVFYHAFWCPERLKLHLRSELVDFKFFWGGGVHHPDSPREKRPYVYSPFCSGHSRVLLINPSVAACN